MRTVIGVFDNKTEAERTIAELEHAGTSAANISVLSKDGITQLGDIRLKPVEVPGHGRLAASGPLMAYLNQSTATAAPDAITAVLVRMGLPQEYATSYVDAVRRGLTLEAVMVEDNKADHALAIMRAHASDLSYDGEPRAKAQKDDAQQVIPVAIEELEIGKREVATGGARVTSHVEEKPVEERVELRQEHVDVERRRVDRPVADTDELFGERTIEVTATSEEPVVAKRARVIEEIVLRKDVETKTETIRENVRRTNVNVEPLGDFDRSLYAKHFDENVAKDEGYDFDAYTPAYRFGHEMRSDQRFTGENWSEVEPSAREVWEEKNPGTWERFKSAVKHAWERATS